MKEVISKISKGILKREFSSDEERDTLLKKLNFSFCKDVWNTLIKISKHAKFNSLFPDFFPQFLKELSLCFDPDMALKNFERFSEIIYDKNYLYTILNSEPWKLKILVSLFSGSQFLSDVLFQNPEYFDWLTDRDTLDSPKFKDTLYKELKEIIEKAVSYDDKLRVLRQFKKREFLRIGLRDLLRKADFVETVEDLSNLADICLQKAYEFCNRELLEKFGVPLFIDKDGEERVCEFVILGMGKLGGRELNFSSDIDLIYLYSSDKGGTAGIKELGDNIINKITNHEYFCRLAQMITSAINDVTEDGFVFRVDLRLRPEGKSGDIAGSLRSYEIYYESWGEPWERQALIKTRPVAGSERLGKEFLDIIKPFVYRKYLDYSSLEEIKDMKERIDQNVQKKGIKGEDIKLGHGGIREIEFLIQAIQLIYGGREKWLQEKNSLRALHKISEKGILTYREYSELSKAYIFLRELENRIQIHRGLQTHELPRDKQELLSLARKVDIREKNSELIIEKFIQSLKENRDNVRNAYKNLFYSDSFKPDEEHHPEIDLFDGEAEYSQVLGYLKKNRFKFPEKAFKNLILLHEGSPLYHPTPKSKRLFRGLAPIIIEICSKLPNPDLAINNLERFISVSGTRRMYYSLFKEKRKLLEDLLILFGSSEFLSNILIQQPNLINLFHYLDIFIKEKSKGELYEELTSLVEKVKVKEELLDEFRKFKKGEELRVGIRSILKKDDFLDTMRGLTNLADVSLIKALEIAEVRMIERYGKPTEQTSQSKLRDSSFAIIGLGKLGGKEFDFGSDLDIVFIYSQDGSTTGIPSGNGEMINRISNRVFYTKLYEEIYQMISGITRSGFLYKIDARLRPDGKKGVMTINLDTLKKYLLKRAEVWEKQAFVKARFIAGSKILGDKAIKIIHKSIYQEKFDPTIASEINNMRKRIEKERGKEKEGLKDIKLGYGGLLEIEFIVQYLQLKYGSRFKSLRDTNTLAILERLRNKDLISKRDCNKLIKAYRFFRETVSGLRIEHERPSSSLPDVGHKLDILASRLGYKSDEKKGSGKKLMDEYDLHTTVVRNIYKSIFNNKIVKSC